MIIGTYRPNDLSRRAPGGELISRLERQHSVEQVRLDRLDRADVAAMLGAIDGVLPSSAAVDAVFRRSGGVPFVIEELVRCCGRGACSEDLLSVQLPWSLDEAVRQQLAEMPAAERRVIDALAVFGGSASFEMISAICELDETELLDRASRARRVVRSSSRSPTICSGSRTRSPPTRCINNCSDEIAGVCTNVRSPHCAPKPVRIMLRSLVTRKAPERSIRSRESLVRVRRATWPRGASFQALRLASDGLAEAPDDPQLLGVATDAAWRLQFGTEAMAYARRWRTAAATDVDRVEAMRFIARLYHEQSDEADRDAALDCADRVL